MTCLRIRKRDSAIKVATWSNRVIKPERLMVSGIRYIDFSRFDPSERFNSYKQVLSGEDSFSVLRYGIVRPAVLAGMK